eukprot:6338622-Heterocapsa_arctica.AAC.1
MGGHWEPSAEDRVQLLRGLAGLEQQPLDSWESMDPQDRHGQERTHMVLPRARWGSLHRRHQ